MDNPRLKIIVVGILLVLAIAFAIPALHDSNLERWLRGECMMQPGGRFASFHCPPLHGEPATPRQ